MKSWEERLIRAFAGEYDVEGVEVVETNRFLIKENGSQLRFLNMTDFDVDAVFSAEDIPAILPMMGRVNRDAIGPIPPGCVLLRGFSTDAAGPSRYQFSVRHPHGWNAVPTPHGWVEFAAMDGEHPYPPADLAGLLP